MSKQAALGAFIGVCVGDASGAVLEFTAEANARFVPQTKIDWAMSMPGGGVHQVGPGQFTDDSELAICLAQGLLESQPPNLPLEAIAGRYCAWAATNPVDCGIATRQAFGTPCSAKEMAARSAEKNGQTQANGALMRCIPLAIWSHKLAPKEIAECCRQDASLSHPHQICQDANAIYCIAVARLISDPGNAKEAISTAKEWSDANAHPDVQHWLTEALSNSALPEMGSATTGWVRWGFTLAFRHLYFRSSFKAAIEDTLSRGGDTDTNAAIVGGMIGALQTLDKIDAHMVAKVLERDVSLGNVRPSFLHPAQVPDLAAKLYTMGQAA